VTGTRAAAARTVAVDSFWINVVGTLAGLCGIIGFTPQIAKIIREHDASAVSLKMYCVTTTAFALWIAFGALQQSWPIILSNSVMFCLAATILVLKLRDRGGEKDP
jgi:MtN3 and saliva related transmembrane protein